MGNNKPTLQSAIVALVLALAIPFLWIVITGETKTAPVMERSYFDKMSKTEIDAWIKRNSTKAGFWQHVKSTPAYLVEYWRGYAQAASVIFVVVFVGNFAYFKFRGRKP